MKINCLRFILVTLLVSAGLAWILLPPGAAAQTPTGIPKVQAVLFYRSTCSHCVQLVVEILPPILDKYGDQLQIFYCDVSRPAGDALFSAAIDQYAIQTIGTPTIIIGKEVLIGSNNIQGQFPGLIEAGLSQGGLSWPDIPGLNSAFTSAGSMQIPVFAPPGSYYSSIPTPVVTGSNVKPEAFNASLLDREKTIFRRDPWGNSLAVLVLTGMIFSVFFGAYAFFRKTGRWLSKRPSWLIPVLSTLGCGVAGYLAYVEIASANAICGPVGHCQVVQESAYARLFGILPVGLLGLAGYAAILITWVISRCAPLRWAEMSALVLSGITALGTLFSIYLTFLEPFVIGAACLWCLTSAVLMTALFLCSIAPGKSAYIHLLKKQSCSF